MTDAPHSRQYVFGPVPSRRLGRSLGVDLVPFKTCSFDCIYCQLGHTTRKTTTRACYAPPDDVIRELSRVLDDCPPPDYVTLSGSGEPTLHADLEVVVAAIKALTNIPLAVLTNGSLFPDARVRAACAAADVVMPTLAACNEQQFQRIHRPCPGLSLERHVAGLVAFRTEHATPMWLELFLLEGINASDADRGAFAELLARIRPHRIQLNTAVRPASEAGAAAVAPEKLRRWVESLGPTAEVVADYAATTVCRSTMTEADVLELCRRRPCTMDDIAAALGLHRNEASKYVASLLAAGSIRRARRDEREYFVA